MIGRNFLEALERKRKLLERLAKLEEELKEEQEKLRVRETVWALETLAAVLEEGDLWNQISKRWEEIAGERFALWKEIGLSFLLPEEGRKERERIMARDLGEKDEQKLLGQQEEQEEAQPEAEAQPRMGGVVF